jgi:RNA polymerase sigma-70 factor (ECF subfamily)
MMLFRNTDRSFAAYQRRRDPRALARVFDGTAPELLRLARHLASSEAAAEDLVQATFVTAIEAAATHRRGEPVLPWLLGILANHARAARRRARRALDGARACRDDTVDPLADAQRSELHAQVRAAIDALPLIYRPVLRLHLDQGLEPGEIARSLERPAGTVRAQIHRGLDLLRAALPAARAASEVAATPPRRGLGAVRAAVLGLPLGAAPAVAPAFGLFAMVNWKWLGTAAALVALGGLAWSNFAGAGASDVADVEERATLVATAEAPAIAASAVSTPPNSDRAAVPPLVAAAEQTTLRVLVLGSGDLRLPPGLAVRVRAVRLDGNPEDAEPEFTDADGIATFVDPPLGAIRVSVDVSDAQAFTTVVAGKVQTVELSVRAGVRMSGTVRDAYGAPVAGAEILAHSVGLVPDPVARSDARGEFRLDHLVSGVALQARARGHAPSVGVRWQKGGHTNLELRLGGRARRVVGVLRDPQGEAVARARVAFVSATARPPADGFAFASFVPTDAHGNFRSDDVDCGALVIVALPPRGSALVSGVAQLAPGDADAAVDLTLRRGAVLSGRVARSDRRPLTVQAFCAEPSPSVGYLANLLGLRRASVAADGTYRLAGLLPGRHQLGLQDAGLQSLAKYDLALEEGVAAEWSPKPGGTRALRIVVQPPPPDRTKPWGVRVYRRGAELEYLGMASTDASGKCSMDVPSDATAVEVVVVARIGAAEAVVCCERDVPVARATHTVTIAQDALPSARLRGRLTDEQGRASAGLEVRARSHVGEVWVSHAVAITARDGSFEFGPLPPGTWLLRVGEPASPVLASVTLAAHQVADCGLLRVSAGK